MKTQKLTLKQLQQLITEAVKTHSKLNESSDDSTVAYAKKVDAFIEETLKKAKDLAEEGNELLVLLGRHVAAGGDPRRDRVARRRDLLVWLLHAKH